MNTTPILLAFLFLAAFPCFGQVLHIGDGQPFPDLESAAAAAQPGDTLLLHGGTYAGGLFIYGLQGSNNAWIHIRNAPGEAVVFSGGNNAIQFSDPAYLHIRGLAFEGQSGNGVNTDDAGTFDTPAHHIVFEGCTFRDMAANGNNDLLKLSGLDHFEVRNCQFLRGADGGSGIDMVGCHYGLITGNYFEEMGSNAIQCKGGSQHVRIERNFFRDGGQRTLNLGGSTGLAFFRPQDAPFEAADLQVYANIFIGSRAPIAYVGSVRVKVVNNTIYQPENWVARILQETVDASRFVECGDNTFQNNLIVRTNSLSTEVNIGPNTRPESFAFSNNLWYHADNANWNGPSLPVTDTDGIVNADPLLADPGSADFSITVGSPAAGAGLALPEPRYDYLGGNFTSPPSIGAIEADPVSFFRPAPNGRLHLDAYPNPAGSQVYVTFHLLEASEVSLSLYGLGGQLARHWQAARYEAGFHELPVVLPTAKQAYLLQLSAGKAVGSVVITRR